MGNKEENKNYKKINLVAGIALGLLLASTATLGVMAINSDSVDTLTVTYVSNNEVIYKEEVKKGENVINVPSLPVIKGNDVAWSNDGTNIQEDTVITSIITPKTYNINILTNIVEKNEMELNTKGDLIDVKSYCGGDYIYLNYYIDFDGVNFTFESENYHFNADYSKVFREDEQSSTASVYDNYFALRNYSFILNAEHTRLAYERNTRCDKNGLFSIDDKLFQIDLKSYQITNLTDNKKETNEFIVSATSNLFSYYPLTQKVKFYEEIDEINVVDYKFTKDSLTYLIDLKDYSFYIIGQDKVNYKTGYVPPFKSTYTYGEDLFFAISDFKLKIFKSNSFTITTQEDSQPDIDGWRFVNGLNVIFDEEECYVGQTDAGIKIYKPVGDITIYLSYSSPSA